MQSFKFCYEAGSGNSGEIIFEGKAGWCGFPSLAFEVGGRYKKCE